MVGACWISSSAVDRLRSAGGSDYQIKGMRANAGQFLVVLLNVRIGLIHILHCTVMIAACVRANESTLIRKQALMDNVIWPTCVCSSQVFNCHVLLSVSSRSPDKLGSALSVESQYCGHRTDDRIILCIIRCVISRLPAKTGGVLSVHC